jgi:TRAP-type C4-dicarboxylate transport system substrate-binding protein
VGRGLLIAFGVLLIASAVTHAQRRSAPIKFGTIVPRGSLWDETLSAMAQQWRSISGGSVRVVVYPGGALGDEIEMVRKVLLGQLDGVALSSVGLSRIDSGVACLQVPLLLNSYGELDYVRDRLAPRLEQRIEAQGFKVLNWADGGWVRVFSRDPARIPDDLRRVKLFTSAGDPEMESLYKRLRFRVVPLSMVDLVTSLQTGMVDAVPSVPLFAQLQGLHKLVPNMLDLKLTPLVGGTVISTRAWNRLPAEHRDGLLEAAQEAGMQLREPIRQLGEDTIAEMSSRGLNVAIPDAATQAVWRDEVEAIYPNLRGEYCPADIFDEVVRLRDEYRAVQ